MKSVAILLATFNGKQYLADFMESLCAQSFLDFCVYIRDDGSSDESLEIIKSYQSRLHIFLISSNERLGPAGSFMELLRVADPSHSCYLFADQDDFWYRDKIERAHSVLLDAVDDVFLYCSRLEYVDEKLNHISFSRLPKMISFRNAVVENIATGCTIGISQRMRSEVLSCKPFDMVMHDWWLYMYASAFGRVFFDQNPSIMYRQHRANAIGAATSFLDDFYRRWTRFRARNGGIHRLSQQLKAFQACYGENMSYSNKSIMNRLINGNKNWYSRLMLAINCPAFRQRSIDSIIIRFLFLMGRY